ncbi:putative multidrug resistance protein EmrK [Methylacidimicrobium cyclopophantes]|uniref:Multidrug resistance protein EmrK n=1 Tax=Methylacidimicrobium cyclopophantes TaxID=1041766 RepID=A0A5E6M9D2_9BACT|nr:HlyD family efflux transporter periplasmic adaptor subunit [Methylacidimicrobium cyclopophantes]VVM06004.1 putative multidrug resistance protein EmrK [Methylacidimicrobium cyclopophantes]
MTGEEWKARLSENGAKARDRFSEFSEGADGTVRARRPERGLRALRLGRRIWERLARRFRTPGPEDGGGVSRQRLFRRAAFGLFLFALLFWIVFAHGWVATNDAYVTGNVAPVKSQVAGTVVEVCVESTERVEKGQTLIRLDGLKSLVALRKAEADLAAAVRRVENLFSQVSRLRHRIEEEKAALGRYRYDLGLYRGGTASGVISEQQSIDAQWKVRESEQAIAALEAELRGSEALVQGTTVETNPMVLQGAQAVRDAWLDWYRRNIPSPVTGYVARRTVQPGDQITPEKLLMTVVPLDYFWVVANFRERELGRMRPGQPVILKSDLYGWGVRYHGVVEGLEPGSGSVFSLLPPDNATGNYVHIVERVPVRIRLDPRELERHPLVLGLSMVTWVHLTRKDRSIRSPITQIPAAAWEADYRSRIYLRELAAIQGRIRKIIEENRNRRGDAPEAFRSAPPTGGRSAR